MGRHLAQAWPTLVQLQGSAAQMPALAGAWPSQIVPLPAPKVEAEDVVAGSTEPGHSSVLQPQKGRCCNLLHGGWARLKKGPCPKDSGQDLEVAKELNPE